MTLAQFHGQLWILEFVEDLLEMVQMVLCSPSVDYYVIQIGNNEW